MMADEEKEGADNGSQEKKSTLDVMNAALDNMPPEGGQPPADTPAADDDQGGEGGDGADDGKPKDDAAADDQDGGDDGAGQGEGDGKDKPAAAAADDDAAKAAKPEKPAEDPYKMPDGLGKKSQERFQYLVDQSKQKDQRLQELEQTVADKDEALSWFSENLMTDDDAIEDVVLFADYRKALRAGDFKSAQEILAAQVRQFTLASGMTLEADPLAAFPDLQKKVDDLAIDREAALELARGRAANSRQQARAQQVNDQQRQADNHKKAVEDAAIAIDKMAAEWKAKDVDYPAKEKIIESKLAELMRTVPVHQVPAQVRILYESLSSVAPRQEAPKPDPLRAGGKGGRPAPASQFDAMNEALGYNS